MATGYILVDSPNPYQSQGTFPRRGGAKLSGTCIVHTSEGNWRSGVDGLTNLVRTRSDWGCYHRAVDWADIALYYPWEWETWQDTETNNWAVGISAACKTTDWGTIPADIEEGYYRNLAKCAADFVVYMSEVHGIGVPLRRISGQEARNRVPGFAAHGDSGVARSDPGANFDWNRFFKYTSEVLNGTATPSEENELNTEQDRKLNAIHDRLFGRDVQRWMDPKNGAVSEAPHAGWVALRSTDLHDVLTLHNLINSNTQKVLDAVKAIPGVDDAVIEGLRDKLALELEEVTKNLSVTLVAAPKVEPSTD